ncbi:hypothetical protein [Streptomyces noursei]
MPTQPTSTIPRPELTPRALRQAITTVAPERLEELHTTLEDAAAQALDENSTTPLTAWLIVWARDIEIARRPDLAQRFQHATDHLEDENPDTAEQALHDLTAVLDEARDQVMP